MSENNLCDFRVRAVAAFWSENWIDGAVPVCTTVKQYTGTPRENRSSQMLERMTYTDPEHTSERLGMIPFSAQRTTSSMALYDVPLKIELCAGNADNKQRTAQVSEAKHSLRGVAESGMAWVELWLLELVQDAVTYLPYTHYEQSHKILNYKFIILNHLHRFSANRVKQPILLDVLCEAQPQLLDYFSQCGIIEPFVLGAIDLLTRHLPTGQPRPVVLKEHFHVTWKDVSEYEKLKIAAGIAAVWFC
ncbi:hypothetical protein CBL_07423 [Carabus blaptoides fortunei]